MATWWDRYTPAQKEYLLKKRNKAIKKGHAKSKRAKLRKKAIEVEVERINDYCGIITESQMRELNGRP